MFRVAALVVVLALAALVGPDEAAAQTRIVAVVNGESITSYDVGQRQRLLRLTGQGGGQAAALDELINEKVQLQAAKRANVTVPDSAVDEAVADIARRVNLSPGQLRQALGQEGVNIGTLRDRLRAQIAFNRLIRTRFRTVLDVSEPDLVAALLKKEGETAIEAPEYDLQQVTIALPQNPSSARLSQAKSVAADLRRRFTSCREGLDMARGTRNVVVQPFGRRTAAELTPQAQEVLEGVGVGRLSETIETPRGLVMFAVCDKKMVRSTNAAMRALEPEIRNERGQAFSKQYVRQLRRDAVIERR